MKELAKARTKAPAIHTVSYAPNMSWFLFSYVRRGRALPNDESDGVVGSDCCLVRRPLAACREMFLMGLRPAAAAPVF